MNWVPDNPSSRRRHIVMSSAKAGWYILAAVGIVCFFMALGFNLGKGISRSTSLSTDQEYLTLQGELIQLNTRVGNLQNSLEQVVQREELAFMAAADMNIDFTRMTDRFALDNRGTDMFRYIDDIELRILLCERLAHAEQIAYDSLAVLLVEKAEQLRHTPSIWPVNGIFVSDFGARVDPFTGAVRYHKGIDISANTGTSIYAPADGTVTFCGWSGGWGLNMVVKHSSTISTRYAHCSAIDVAVGQSVQRGDLIARVGSTGRSVGPHVHYEVLRNGVQIDPEDFIIRAGPAEAAF
ncbi:MAG: M23 family metallopeptidase [Candidatus Sabulitectum sp.]|nr:M23 family metallopeptidase [Candidatus Sabulitectum sp.]